MTSIGRKPPVGAGAVAAAGGFANNKILPLKAPVKAAVLAAAKGVKLADAKPVNGLLGSAVNVGTVTLADGKTKASVFFMFNVPLGSGATIDPNTAGHFYLRVGDKTYIPKSDGSDDCSGFPFTNPTKKP
jgi:hypothetical protein